MNKYAIVCLDTNPISVDQFQTELRSFTDKFDLYCTESLEDARQTIEFIHQQNQIVSLLIAAQHEALNGAEFLIQLNKNALTKLAKKVLISSGKDIEVILNTLNEGRLDYCLTRPLQNRVLFNTVQSQLTEFVIEQAPNELLHYSQILDQDRLLRAHIDKSMQSFRNGFIADYHALSDMDLAENVIVSLYAFFEKEDETKACRTYSANHLLTREGEENQFLWFITSGEVALYKQDHQGAKHEVVRHRKGGLVGGMSFVTGEASFSTAITLSRTHVIKLDREVFAKVMNSNSELLPLFTNLLLRHFNRRLQRSITTKLELQETMASLGHAQQQLVEREKMAVLGQLVAGVAHELNNPIAAILSNAETLAKQFHRWISSPLAQCPSDFQSRALEQNLYAHPLSTSIERERVKALSSKLGDKKLAKKLVKLRLDEEAGLVSLCATEPQLAAQTLEEIESYATSGRSLRAISVCAQRIADMVKSLKSYARADEEAPRELDIHEGIEDTLVIFESRLKYHHVTKEFAALGKIRCQANAIQQVWTNLISNAIDALPTQGGQLTINTSTESINGDVMAKIAISDNGKGMPENIITRVFELNFTTKKEGNFGLGIGLSVCKQIVEQHSGIINIDSSPGLGTTISVYLPMSHHEGLL